MDFLQATILSIVEGITEFLPVSSTEHLILTSKLLSVPQSEFIKKAEGNLKIADLSLKNSLLLGFIELLLGVIFLLFIH